MGMRKLGGFEQLPTIDLQRNGVGTETKVKFLDFKDNVGNFGKTIYTVEEGGEKKQFWGNKVLDRILAEAQQGDNLTIIFRGEFPSKVKGQHPFKNFEVFADDPSYEGDDSQAGEGAKKKVPF